jgi:WD40 repeat protein
MGLLDRFLGRDEETDEMPEIAEEFTITGDSGGWLDIEYGGEMFHVQQATSPSGEYTGAYRDGIQGGDDPQRGRVFLIRDDELAFTTELDRPNGCAVADDGTIAVVDWGLEWGQDLSGTLHVFDADGNRLLEHAFDVNIESVAITPDGNYAATATLDPDRSICAFDLTAGKLVLRHKVPNGPARRLEFVETEEWLLEFGGPELETTRITLEGRER